MQFAPYEFLRTVSDIPPPNVHGTAVVVGDGGILIIGPSGAGKTSLALALVNHAKAIGRFGRLVGDDQVFLSSANGKLIARAAGSIAGLAEARGYGPTPITAEHRAIIDLVLRLVEGGTVPRLQEAQPEQFHGALVPSLHLPARDTVQAMNAVTAWFAWPPFG